MEWQTIESTNYIFNYHVNSIDESEIQKIIEKQETCNEYISAFLKVKMKEKIRYFLCDSPTEVGQLYGDNEPCNGFARMPNEIYAVYNQSIKCIGFHEDLHLIANNTISRPAQTFIREGLAMFFDRVYWGIPNYEWVKNFVNNGICVKVKELVINDKFYTYSDIVSYPIAGAFTEYLISYYGIEKFKDFYKNVDVNFESCFLNVFNSSLDEVESSFIKYINCISSNEFISDSVKSYLKERNII